jgi:large subunit ribosomal protein L25
MKRLLLSGSSRENVGKKDAKKHRREGNVPCVIYGGKEQIHFVIPEPDLKKLIFTPDTFIIDLTVDGKACVAILQDIQYHPVSDRILHIDFLQIFDDKPVIVSVPLRFSGTSQGILKGGRMVRKYRKVRIKGLIANLPDEVVVDITDLDIGDSIKIADLFRDNIEFLDVPTSIAASVKTQRVIIDEEEEGAEGAEGAEGEEGAEGAEGGEAAAPAEGGQKKG